MKSEKTKFSKVLACNLHEFKTRHFAYSTILTLKLPWISSVNHLVSLIITYWMARSAGVRVGCVSVCSTSFIKFTKLSLKIEDFKLLKFQCKYMLIKHNEV